MYKLAIAQIGLFLLSQCVPVAAHASIECPVTDLSAKGGAGPQNARAVQRAISLCAANRTHHGVVTLKAGDFPCSSILVDRSYITLYVPESTTLRASLQRLDYGPGAEGMSLIRLHNCTECALAGGGVLDGRGRDWVAVRWPTRKLTRNWPDPRSCPVPSECRPNLVKLIHVTQASVSGLRLVDAAYWTVHVLRSRAIDVSGLTIRNDPEIANTDGIDIDGSLDVRVHNCSILTGDDAIVVKTTGPERPLRRLHVTNCTLASKSAAVKIGSETRSDLSDLTFSDIQVLPSHRGIAIQLRDEGSVSNVTFERMRMDTELYNASWWGAGEPVAITALPRRPDTQVGSIGGIRLCNIHAVSENGIFIAGSSDSIIRNIHFQDVRLDLRRLTGWPGGLQDRRPGMQGLREAPASLIYQEYASNVTYCSVKMSWAADRPEWQQALGGEPHTVSNLQMTDFSLVDTAATSAARSLHHELETKFATTS